MTLSDSGPPPSARTAYDWPLMVLVGVAALLLGAIVMLRRPDLVFTGDFLTHDQGVQLLIGDRLSSGALLYRDVAYPYGPVPAYLLAAVTRLCGMSATVYLSLVCVVGAGFLTVLTHALRQHVDRVTAASVALLGVLPLTATPGAVLGGYTNNSYIGIERLVLALQVLSWESPDRRSVTAAVRMGLLFGAWQLVKFGGAAVGIAAWLIVDALSVWRHAESFGWRPYLRCTSLTLGVFGAVEACRWATLFAVLPYDVAWDVAWPAYTAQLYETIAASAKRIGPASITEFATQWLPALMGAVLSAWIAAAALARRGERRHLALLLPPAFYLVASLGYFGHGHTVRQYVWTLVPAAAVLLQGRTRPLQLVATAAVAPAVALALKIALTSHPAADRHPVAMPNGDQLWLDPTHAAQVPRVLAAMTSSPVPFAITATGGLYFYARAALPTRHPWLLPRYVRPYEHRMTSNTLHTRGSVLILDDTASTAEQASSLVDSVFGPGTFAGLEADGATLHALAPNWWLMAPAARSVMSTAP